MRRLELACLAGVALATVGFCLLGWLAYDYSTVVLRLPVMVTAAMLVLISARAVALLRGPAPGVEAVAAPHSQPELKDGWVKAVLWLLAVLPAVVLLGYPLGLGLYVLAFVRLHGHGWRTAVAVGAAISGLSYLGFALLLSVPLPLVPLWMAET